MSFVCFTDKQKERARRTNLVELLRSQGETVKRSGSEYAWKDGSQKVTIRDNLWFHQYERVGGDAIDFVRRFYNKSYPEAVEYLLGNSSGGLITAPPVVKEKKPFELPKPYHNMERVKNYLHYVRGIDEDIIEVCKRIRLNEDNSITPIIVISSNIEKEHRIEVLKECVEHYIKVPIDKEYLFYTIKNIIRLLFIVTNDLIQMRLGRRSGWPRSLKHHFLISKFTLWGRTFLA